MDVPGTSSSDQTEKTLEIKVNMHVLVKFSEAYVPAKVLQIENYMFSVKCMESTGVIFWKWPEFENIHIVERPEIISEINEPARQGNRGKFRVPESEKFQVNKQEYLALCYSSE
jgi:hypothetical protein